MIKKIIFIILIILLATSVGGYFFYKYSKPKSLGKIVYGYEVWPGVLPYLVAYEKGYFREQGLEVELKKADSYTEEVESFISGQVDFMGDFALVDIIKKISLGEKIKVILASDYTSGADGIVAKKEIKNVAELKGKKVAVEKDTLGEYLLYDALKKNKLSLSDIQEINLSAQDGAQSFIRGEVDAAVTYEPDFTEAVEKGNGWRVYTSAQSPGLIVDTLAFKSSFVEHNPEKVMAVVAAYIKAVDYIYSNQAEAYAIGEKYLGISAPELAKQITNIRLMTKDDNYNAFFYKTTIDSLHGSIIQANNFLLQNGVIKNKVDSTEVLDGSFIRSIE